MDTSVGERRMSSVMLELKVEQWRNWPSTVDPRSELNRSPLKGISA